MPIGPPSQRPEPKSACTGKGAPIALTIVRELLRRGRWFTGLFQTFVAGKRGQAGASGSGTGAALAVAENARARRAAEKILITTVSACGTASSIPRAGNPPGTFPRREVDHEAPLVPALGRRADRSRAARSRVCPPVRGERRPRDHHPPEAGERNEPDPYDARSTSLFDLRPGRVPQLSPARAGREQEDGHRLHRQPIVEGDALRRDVQLPLRRAPHGDARILLGLLAPSPACSASRQAETGSGATRPSAIRHPASSPVRSERMR